MPGVQREVAGSDHEGVDAIDVGAGRRLLRPACGLGAARGGVFAGQSGRVTVSGVQADSPPPPATTRAKPSLTCGNAFRRLPRDPLKSRRMADSQRTVSGPPRGAARPSHANRGSVVRGDPRSCSNYRLSEARRPAARRTTRRCARGAWCAGAHTRQCQREHARLRAVQPPSRCCLGDPTHRSHRAPSGS